MSETPAELFGGPADGMKIILRSRVPSVLVPCYQPPGVETIIEYRLRFTNGIAVRVPSGAFAYYLVKPRGQS